MSSKYDNFFNFFWLCTTSINKIFIKLTFIVHVGHLYVSLKAMFNSRNTQQWLQVYELRERFLPTLNLSLWKNQPLNVQKYLKYSGTRPQCKTRPYCSCVIDRDDIESPFASLMTARCRRFNVELKTAYLNASDRSVISIS